MSLGGRMPLVSMQSVQNKFCTNSKKKKQIKFEKNSQFNGCHKLNRKFHLPDFIFELSFLFWVQSRGICFSLWLVIYVLYTM